MRNVHCTCDRCGETLRRPGYEKRGEHDGPDVGVMIGNLTTCVRFDMCAGCLVKVVRDLEIGNAKRAESIGPNRGTLGDALDALTPYNAKL